MGIGASTAADAFPGVIADVAPTPTGAVPLVDAPKPLLRDAPPTLVRDARGRISVELPSTSRLSGRQRSSLSTVHALPHLGGAVIAALFEMCRFRTTETWLSRTSDLRVFADHLVEARLGDTPVADLPHDVVDTLAGLRATRQGRALSGAQRECFNYVRAVLRNVPGTGHLDLAHRDNPVERPGAWRMDEGGEVVATSKFGLTDADIEKLVQRSSAELRAMIARRNQFVAFLGGERNAPGPSSPDLLEAAAEMLAAHPTEVVFWKHDFARRSGPYMRLLRVGWDWLGELEDRIARGEARDVAPKTLKAVALRRRHLEKGGTAADLLRRRSGGCAVVEEGWLLAARLAYPTGRDMVAPLALMGLLTRFNLGQLVNIGEHEFRERIRHPSEIEEDGEEADVGSSHRLFAAPYKPRARRIQPVDFPVGGSPEDPAPLAEFVRRWTAHVREGDRPDGGRLFVFMSLERKGGGLISFVSDGGDVLRREFAGLTRRAGTIELPPRALRTMGVDIIHERTHGDQQLVHGAGNWAPGSKSPLLYLAGPALARDRERLFWATKLLERERLHGVRLGDRPSRADLFSATDGFRCRDPLGSPDPIDRGELCRARGMCAICRFGDLDVGAPTWSFARIVSLADHIVARLRSGATDTWARRYRPVLREIIDIWIPMFPADVVASARDLPTYPMEELPDVLAA